MSCNWVLYKQTVRMLTDGMPAEARMSLHWANDGKGQVGPDGRRVYVTDAGWVHLQRELVKPEPDLTMHHGHYIYRTDILGRPPIGGAKGKARKVDFMCELDTIAQIDETRQRLGMSRAKALRAAVAAWLAANAPSVPEDATNGAPVSGGVDPYLT
jgi:hypothetical protein